MATIKNNSNTPKTISYQKPDKQYVHTTVQPGESTREIPDVDALKTMTSRNPDWIGVWIPGDQTTQKLLDATKPKVEIVGKKEEGEKGGKK